MSLSEPLLKTKLKIPFTRKDLVNRPRLLDRLMEGFQGPLTLVTAPAGYGKTTLVTAGLAMHGQLREPAVRGEPAVHVAWLSLDPADNSMERFLRYLLFAFQQMDARIGQDALDILDSGQSNLPERILSPVINDLDKLHIELILVLDDYQVINNLAIHEAIAFLLDHGPSGLRLVIITRSDPPIPLARLRARGQVVELRAADLRFTAEEAGQFLNEGMGLQLDLPSVQMLTDRTEGWAAGLQMAALSLHNRSDASRRIERFSGTNRYILDYLLEEVLANQPPETQRFLLFTAVLERMCAPLCDALLQIDETAAAPSAVMLDTLERANLFLVALDEERYWYRYHHLFADLLRVRLDTLYPGMSVELHRRAAAWLEQAGLTVEAVNHALAGGATGQAARLVEENTTTLLVQGELNALMGWIEALPEALRQDRPKLCIHQAYALAFAGKLAGVEPLLQQAERALAAQSDKAGEGGALAGSIAAVRAMAAVMAGRDLESIALTNQARALLPQDQPWDRASATWALGYAQRSLGHLTEARAAFEEMVTLARQMGNLWTLVTGLMDLANVVRAQGELVRARALYEEALREAGRQGARRLGYLARMEVGLADVLYEQNDLAGAQQILSNAIARMHQWPNPNHLAYALVVQIRLYLAQGDLTRAREALEQVTQVREREPLVRNVRRMAEVSLVRLWLKQQEQRVLAAPGDRLAQESAALLAQWRAEAALTTQENFDADALAARVMLAREMRFDQQPAQALSYLQPVTEWALRTGNTSGAIEALNGMTLTQHALGQAGEALAALEKALGLAQPGGFVRTFLDEGLPLQRLLAQWLARSEAHPLRAYALHLLVQFDQEPLAAELVMDLRDPAQSLPEPLSQREVEVLGLMAQGLTNAAIAAQLIVSTGTVKAHTAAIYRKLDVANRTEAVARARQLHILP